MDLIIVPLFLLLYLFASVTCFCYEAHMFQLNSYQAGTHLKWTLKNLSGIIPNILALFLAVYAVFLMDIVRISPYFEISRITVCLALLLMGLANLPRKGAKTPLVYTARVKRMMVTYLVIMAAGAAVSWFFSEGCDYFGIMLAFYGFAPIVLLLANLINSPIEAAVRRWYLNDALKMLRSCPDLTVIGITGSYGKTSMKFFLSEILKQKHNILMTPGNFNTPMGVTRTVRSSLKGYHEYFVCEMGAKKVGEIKELCDIARPVHGIVTSVGPQHLESFKSIENIISTKLELANNLNGGKAFLNLDNEYIRENLTEGAITYGTNPEADYRAEVLSVSKAGTKFAVTYPDGSRHEFTTVLIGAHNVTNLCGAVAMANFLGVEDHYIEEGVARITPVPHRLQLIKKPGLTIIDDAYNSNPSGCKAALDTLSYFDDFKILVTPGMVELGAEEEKLNREFGRQAAAVCDFVIPVGEKRAVPIVAGLHDAGYPDEKIYIAKSIGDAMAKVYAIQADRPKAVLLENDLPDNY